MAFTDLPAAIVIHPRSRNRLEYRYTVETQAPAGNWVTCVRLNSRSGAIETAVYQRDTLKKTVRIIDEWK